MQTDKIHYKISIIQELEILVKYYYFKLCKSTYFWCKYVTELNNTSTSASIITIITIIIDTLGNNPIQYNTVCSALVNNTDRELTAIY